MNILLSIYLENNIFHWCNYYLMLKSTFGSLRLVIYTIKFASEFCVEFVCRILLSKVTNKVLESRRNLEIESKFRHKFDSR